MKVVFPLLLMASSVCAQENAGGGVPPLTPDLPLTPNQKNGVTQNYMLISPQERASDYQKAFEQLKKEKTTAKVYFQLSDGSTISNIIDMNLLPSSTLILFRYNSSQGVKYQVVKIEEITNLSYQP